MKNLKKIIILALTLVIVMSTLCACGDDNKTLEDFYSGDKMKQIDSQIEMMKAQQSSTIRDIKYSVDENTVTYSYYFAYQVSDSEWSANEPMVKSGLDAQGKSIVDGLKKEAGVDDTVTVVYEYYNLDGSLLGSYSYSN